MHKYGLVDKMLDYDGIVAIFNNALIVIDPALKFNRISCKQDSLLIDSYQSLTTSKLKLTSIISDIETFTGKNV